jgi:hypothetical protein
MSNARGNFFIGISAAIILTSATRAQDLNTIGVVALRMLTTNLDGTGIRVAQPEADYDLVTNFEVNPATTGQPGGLFTYLYTGGSATNFPNGFSSESGHADQVAQIFYGVTGVATNVAHVDNIEANDFYTNYIANFSLPSIGDRIVNQSFTFGALSTNDQQSVDSQYDNYAVQNKILFVSAVNNFGTVPPNSINVCAPGTSYNCIGVGAYANSTYYNSLGPTIDNGRCKPDITALSGATSFSTPQVSGAAAILLQAGLRGDGGSDTNSAADLRTIKALLLNGAVKPIGWTNVPPQPLDTNYGAGVLNILNSYEQLAGGKNNFISATTFSTGNAHPPDGASGTISNLSAWDLNTNTSSSSLDSVNHYYFNAGNTTNFNSNFILTATLVWNRHKNKTAINNLDLFLFNAANSDLIASSTSLVDNVEHIFLPRLASGRYDLQVWKAGGAFVSAGETYALAWEFLSPTLAATKNGTNLALTFPIYPAGFLVEATTNLLPPINWSTNLPSPLFTNNQNYLLLNTTNSVQFFRLRRPNF